MRTVWNGFVIGVASGFELTKEFLATMHSRYF